MATFLDPRPASFLLKTHQYQSHRVLHTPPEGTADVEEPLCHLPAMMHYSSAPFETHLCLLVKAEVENEVQINQS